MLTYLTAGESHGKGIAALVDGFPAGVTLDAEFIARELQRRQSGYGRGGRQAIETDAAEILTGVLHGVSMGSPILLWVKNRDYKLESMPELTRPRPGHADLTGALQVQEDHLAALGGEIFHDGGAEHATGSGHDGVQCSAYGKFNTAYGF